MAIRVEVQNVVGMQGRTGAATDTIPDEAILRDWVAAALTGRRGQTELTLRIVDEVEIATLNATYRHTSGPTNVLSFPFEAPPGVPLPLLGDLVICAPVLEREARAQGKTLEAHWAHMVVHGCLHLLGHDHLCAGEAAVMETREIEILSTLGYPDPYVEQS